MTTSVCVYTHMSVCVYMNVQILIIHTFTELQLIADQKSLHVRKYNLRSTDVCIHPQKYTTSRK
jgi:hypothetical protein